MIDETRISDFGRMVVFRGDDGEHEGRLMACDETSLMLRFAGAHSTQVARDRCSFKPDRAMAARVAQLKEAGFAVELVHGTTDTYRVGGEGKIWPKGNGATFEYAGKVVSEQEFLRRLGGGTGDAG